MKENIFENTLEILEYRKVLDIIASYCNSNQSADYIKKLNILSNIEEINYSLDSAIEMREILSSLDNFFIGEIKDDRIIRNKLKYKNTVLSPEEIVFIGNNLTVAKRIKKFFEDKKDKYKILYELSKNLTLFDELERKITNSIDFETYEILDSASSKLQHIRAKKNKLREEIYLKLKNIMDNLPSEVKAFDDYVTLRNDRYVIPVTKVNKNMNVMVLDRSAGGGTYFVEPLAVMEMNNNMRELVLEEEDEIYRILSSISAELSENYEKINENSEIIIKFDIIYAKGKYAYEFDANKPIINTKDKKISILGGYHPLLLYKHKLNREKVVPLNLEIPEKIRALIITGANAGGKTVVLKTIGLFSLMLHSGLPITAGLDTTLPLFSKVLADIGDEQSIENDLSTFSGHITHIAEILKQADDNTLVLLDEVGSGTDPEEGAALAISIIESLINKHSLLIATTHYKEVKLFVSQNDYAMNSAMQFDEESLQPTYKLIVGIPGNSYAFYIAERLGIPKYILERAKDNINSKSWDINNLIKELSLFKMNLEKEANELRKKSAELEKEKKEIELAKETYFKTEKKLRKEFSKDFKSIINEAEKEINLLLKEAVKAKNDTAKISQKKKELKDISERVSKNLKEEEIAIESEKASEVYKFDEIRTGIKVFVKSLNKEGKIEEIINENNILLNMDGIAYNTKINDLYKLKKEEDEKNETKVVKTNAYQDNKFIYELDVRGYRTEDALRAVEKFLDEAVWRNADRVRIIHGVGTGTLRKFIWQYLKEYPYVDNYKEAERHMGGYGATEVSLKT